jgi:uncharacterized delta-60 repeat protein
MNINNKLVSTFTAGALTIAISGLLNPAMASTAGDLDPTFGTASDGTPDGIVNLSLGNGNDVGKSVAVQHDGKVVVVVVGVSEQNGSTNIEVIRLRKDGSLDTTFGTANDGTVDGVVNIDLGPGNDVGTGVAIDRKSGKIVVSGYHTVSGSSNMIAARLLKDGTLDESFGTANDGTPNGVVSISLGSGGDQANAVAVQQDGKIVLAGSSSSLGTHNIEVIRLKKDGTLDTKFGTGNDGTPDGVVNIDLGIGDDIGKSVALTPDGRIVVAGDHTVNGSTNMIVARLKKTGDFDTKFGRSNDGTPDGVVNLSLGDGNDMANSVAVQKDGKIVVAGSSVQGSSSNIEVVRFTRTGELDQHFGVSNDGTPNGVVNLDLGTGNDIGRAVAIQPNGKIVVAGSHFVSGSSNILVGRLLKNGALDGTFGQANDGTPDGLVSISLGSGDDEANAVALEAGRKILVAGSSVQGGSANIEVVRLIAK